MVKIELVYCKVAPSSGAPSTASRARPTNHFVPIQPWSVKKIAADQQRVKLVQKRTWGTIKSASSKGGNHFVPIQPWTVKKIQAKKKRVIKIDRSKTNGFHFVPLDPWSEEFKARKLRPSRDFKYKHKKSDKREKESEDVGDGEAEVEEFKVVLDLSEEGPIFRMLEDMIAQVAAMDHEPNVDIAQKHKLAALKRLLSVGIPGIEGILDKVKSNGGKFSGLSEESKQLFLSALTGSVFQSEDNDNDSGYNANAADAKAGGQAAALLIACAAANGDANVASSILEEMMSTGLSEEMSIDPEMMNALMMATAMAAKGVDTQEILATMRHELMVAGHSESETSARLAVLEKALMKESPMASSSLTSAVSNALNASDLEARDVAKALLLQKALVLADAEAVAKLLVTQSKLSKKGVDPAKLANVLNKVFPKNKLEKAINQVLKHLNESGKDSDALTQTLSLIQAIESGQISGLTELLSLLETTDLSDEAELENLINNLVEKGLLDADGAAIGLVLQRLLAVFDQEKSGDPSSTMTERLAKAILLQRQLLNKMGDVSTDELMNALSDHCSNVDLSELNDELRAVLQQLLQKGVVAEDVDSAFMFVQTVEEAADISADKLKELQQAFHADKGEVRRITHDLFRELQNKGESHESIVKAVMDALKASGAQNSEIGAILADVLKNDDLGLDNEDAIIVMARALAADADTTEIASVLGSLYSRLVSSGSVDRESSASAELARTMAEALAMGGASAEDIIETMMAVLHASLDENKGVSGVDAELDVVETVAQVLVEAGASPKSISRVLATHLSHVSSAEVAAETATICSKAMAAAGATAEDILAELSNTAALNELDAETKTLMALLAVAGGIRMAQSPEDVSDTMHKLAAKTGMSMDAMENEVITAMLESGASVKEVAQVISRFGFLRAVGVSVDEMADLIMAKLDKDELIDNQDVIQALDLGGVDHETAMKCLVAQNLLANVDVGALAKLTRFQQFLSQKCGISNEKIARLMSALKNEEDDDNFEQILENLDFKGELNSSAVSKCLDFLVEMSDNEDIVSNMDPKLLELVNKLKNGRIGDISIKDFKAALIDFLGIDKSCTLNTLLCFQQSLSSLNLNSVDLVKVLQFEKTMEKKGASLDDIAHIMGLSVDDKKFKNIIKMTKNALYNGDEEDNNDLLSTEINLVLDLAGALDLANDMAEEDGLDNNDDFVAKVAMAKALNKVDMVDEDNLITDASGMAKTVMVQRACVALDLSSDDITTVLSLKTALEQLGMSHLLDELLKKDLDDKKVKALTNDVLNAVKMNKEKKVCDSDLLANSILNNVFSNLDPLLVEELKSRLNRVSNPEELKSILKELNLDVDKLIKVNMMQQVMTDLELDANTMQENVRVQRKLMKSEKLSRNTICDMVNEKIGGLKVAENCLKGGDTKQKLIKQNKIGVDMFVASQSNVDAKVGAVLNAVGLDEEQVARVVSLQRVLNELGASGKTLMELIRLQQSLVDDDNADPKAVMDALAKHVDADTLSRVLAAMDNNKGDNSKNILLDLFKSDNNAKSTMGDKQKEKINDVTALQLAMLSAEMSEEQVMKILQQLNETSDENQKDAIALDLLSKNLKDIKQSDVQLIRSADQVAKDRNVAKLKKQLQKGGENEKLLAKLLALNDSENPNKALFDSNELAVIISKDSCAASLFDLLTNVDDIEDKSKMSDLAALSTILLNNMSSQEAKELMKKIVSGKLSSEEKKRLLKIIEKSDQCSEKVRKSALNTLNNDDKANNNNKVSIKLIESLVDSVDSVMSSGQMSSDECLGLIEKAMRNNKNVKETLEDSKIVKNRKKEQISGLVSALTNLDVTKTDSSLVSQILDIEKTLLQNSDLGCDEIATLLGQLMRKEITQEDLMNKLKSQVPIEVMEKFKEDLGKLSKCDSHLSDIALANLAKIAEICGSELKMSNDEVVKMINDCGDKSKISKIIKSVTKDYLKSDENNEDFKNVSDVISALDPLSNIETTLSKDHLETISTIIACLQTKGFSEDKIMSFINKLSKGELNRKDLKDIEEALDNFDDSLKTKLHTLIRDKSIMSDLSDSLIDKLVNANKKMIEAGFEVDKCMDIVSKALNKSLKQMDLDEIAKEIANKNIRPDQINKLTKVMNKLEELQERQIAAKSDKIEDLLLIMSCLKDANLSKEDVLSLMNKLNTGKLSKNEKDKLKSVIKKNKDAFDDIDAVMEAIDTNAFSKSNTVSKDDLVAIIDALDIVTDIGMDRKKALVTVMNSLNNTNTDEDRKTISALVTGKSEKQVGNLASMINAVSKLDPNQAKNTVNEAFDLLAKLDKANLTDLVLSKLAEISPNDTTKIAEIVQDILGAVGGNGEHLQSLLQSVVKEMGVKKLQQLRRQRQVLKDVGINDKMCVDLLVSNDANVFDVVLGDVGDADTVKQLSDALKPKQTAARALSKNAMGDVALINRVLRECDVSDAEISDYVQKMINGDLNEKAIKELIEKMKESKKVDNKTLKKVSEILKESNKKSRSDLELRKEDVTELLNNINVLQSKLNLSEEQVANILKKASENDLDDNELNNIFGQVVKDKQMLTKVKKLHSEVTSKLNNDFVSDKGNIEACLNIRDALLLSGKTEEEATQLLHKIISGQVSKEELKNIKNELIKSNLFTSKEIEKTVKNLKRIGELEDENLTIGKLEEVLKLGKELSKSGSIASSKMAALVHRAVNKGLTSTELASLQRTSELGSEEQLHLLCRIYSALKSSAMGAEEIRRLMDNIVNDEFSDDNVLAVLKAVKRSDNNKDVKELETLLRSGQLQRLNADVTVLDQLSLLQDALETNNKLTAKQRLGLMAKAAQNKLGKSDMAKVLDALDQNSNEMSKEQKEKLKQLKQTLQEGSLKVDKVNKEAFDTLVNLRDALDKTGTTNLAEIMADVLDVSNAGETNKEKMRSVVAAVLSKHDVLNLSMEDMEKVISLRSNLDTLKDANLEAQTLHTMHKLAAALINGGWDKAQVQQTLGSLMSKTRLESSVLKRIEQTLRSDRAGMTEDDVDSVLDVIRSGAMCANNGDNDEVQSKVDALVASLGKEELVKALLAQQVLGQCLDNKNTEDKNNVMEDLAKLILVQDSLIKDGDLNNDEVINALNKIANSNSASADMEQRAKQVLREIKRNVDKNDKDALFKSDNMNKLSKLVSMVDKGSRAADLLLNKVGPQQVQLYVDAHSESPKSSLLARLRAQKRAVMDDVALMGLEVSELLTAAGLNKNEMEEMLGFVVNRAAASKPFVKSVKDVLARKDLSVLDRLEWLRDVLEDEVSNVCSHLRTAFLNNVPSEEDVSRTCDDIADKFSKRNDDNGRNDFRAALMDILDDAMQDVSVKSAEGDAVFNYFMVAALASTSEEVETRGKEGALSGTEVHELMRQRVFTMIQRLLKEAELSDLFLPSFSASASLTELRSTLNLVLKKEEAKKRLNRRIALLFDLDGVEHTTILAMTLLDVIRDARHALRPWDLSKMCRHQRKVKGLRRAKVPTLAYSQVFCFYKVLPDHREGPTIGFNYEK